ncbi:hypothetical protein IMY05_019G0023800 [Salix suchowensis]|nr:hypothetical protein IMY05_019G0023800 [Salix suchowensis]
METIRERLMRLETWIGSDEEGEECSIIDRLRYAIESAERAESLYISLAAESSERLDVAKETIAILKRAITNNPNGEGYASASFKSKGRDKEEKKKKNFGGGTSKAVAADKGKAKFAQGKGTKPNFTCFICDGPHFARECPMREKLNAIRVGDSEEDEGVVTHVNPMRVIN